MYPETASAGDKVQLELNIENTGVAPIYKDTNLKIRLVNGEKEYAFNTDVDIKKWFPGKYENKISVTLPTDIIAGNYDIEVNIGNEQYPLIYLCTDAVRNDNYYQVGNISIK